MKLMLRGVRQSRIELMKAIHNARKSILKVEKNSKIGSRKHIHIDDVIEAIQPHLDDNDLVVHGRCIFKPNLPVLYRVTIEHKLTGQKISDTRIYDGNLIFVEGAKKIMNPIQAGGSFETYTRRYALMGLLNLQGEDDTDGADRSEAKKVIGEKKITVKKYDFEVTTEMLDKALIEHAHGKEMRDYILGHYNIENISALNQDDKQKLYTQLIS